MKKILLFVILFNSFFLSAQNAQELIVGLKQDLKNNPDDKKLATIYSDLTWYYSNISIDSALNYGRKAIIASTKLGDSTLIAQVYSDVGAVYFRKGDYLNSKQNYLKAYSIRKTRNDFAGMSKVNGNLANIYNKLGDKKQALKSYLETIDYFEKYNNQEVVAITKANVGFLFHEIKNYPKALKYLNDAISYQEEKKFYDGLCTSYLTLGNVYLKMKDTAKALSTYEKCIISSKKVGNKVSLSSALVNIGNIKSLQNKSTEASNFYNKSKQLKDSINITNEESILSLGIVKENIIKGKIKLAKSSLLTLRKTYETDVNDKENLLQTYQFLIQTSAYLSQPDSVNVYMDKFSALENKILESNIIKQTNELETKYQTAKKEKLILEQDAAAKQKNIWLIVIASLAAIGLILYNQQRIKSKQQKVQSLLENELLQEQSNYKIQEQRLDISRELHDSVGSQLTFIISILDNLKNAPVKLDTVIEKKIDNLSGYANNSISELRDTIWALNTENLTIKELETRILNFIKDAGESLDTIDFDFKNNIINDQQLTSKQGITIFRVLQESVNNAIKHASASKITIELSATEKQLTMQIHDNGKGFNYEEKKKKSYGLTNLRNRIEEINGNFDLSSNDNGTIINIEIPTAK